MQTEFSFFGDDRMPTQTAPGVFLGSGGSRFSRLLAMKKGQILEEMALEVLFVFQNSEAEASLQGWSRTEAEATLRGRSVA